MEALINFLQDKLKQAILSKETAQKSNNNVQLSVAQAQIELLNEIILKCNEKES